MAAYRDQNFVERLNVATAAKKAMRERLRAKQSTDDPLILERRAARQAITAARETRVANRKAARELEKLRQAADQEAWDTEAALQTATQEARSTELQVEEKVRAASLEAEQKAARDARYAARKARR
jgi:hypothetical protein